MKNWIIFLSLIIGGCVSNQQEDVSVTPYQYSQSEADTLYKYLKLVDSAYVFTLSKEEALQKGISERGFQELEECISNVNQGIREAIEDGVTQFSLSDPQEFYKKKKENKK